MTLEFRLRPRKKLRVMAPKELEETATELLAAVEILPPLAEASGNPESAALKDVRAALGRARGRK